MKYKLVVRIESDTELTKKQLRDLAKAMQTKGKNIVKVVVPYIGEE